MSSFEIEEIGTVITDSRMYRLTTGPVDGRMYVWHAGALIGHVTPSMVEKDRYSIDAYQALDPWADLHNVTLGEAVRVLGRMHRGEVAVPVEPSEESNR